MTQPPAPAQLDDAAASFPRPALRGGVFPAGKNMFLPWQGTAKPAQPSAGKTGRPAGGGRGTVILLNDYGAAFSAAQALPLAARGFACVSCGWYLQPQTAAHFSADGANPHPRFSRNFSRAALSAFLRHSVLPEYPPPFYLLAQGAGALFALSAHGLLEPIVSRMVAVAPVFSIRGHGPHSFYRAVLQFCGLFSYPSYSSALPAQKSFAYRAHLLREAAAALKTHSGKTMKLPCLLIITGAGSKTDSAQTRLLAETLRLADSLTFPSAAPDFLCREEAKPLRGQFWAAFDAFIPGGDANAANTMLEHAMLL